MKQSSFPKITIVTPNYNCVEFLERTIQSVLSQEYPNLEYIIIDGGSTDGSQEVIKKYQSKLTFWVSEKDNGLYDAINKGFARSSGEIMGWINSDDILAPNSLFHLAEIFSSHPTVNWLQGLPTLIDEDDKVIVQKDHAYSKYYFLLDLYKEPFDPIQQESTFWRRPLWQMTGASLDTNFSLAGDFDLWIRFFAKEVLFCTSKQLGAFRVRRGQKSENLVKYVEEADRSIRKHKAKFGIVTNSHICLYKIVSHLHQKLNNKYSVVAHYYYKKYLMGGKQIVQ